MTPNHKKIISLLLAGTILLSGCTSPIESIEPDVFCSKEGSQKWTMGFGCREIIYTPAQEETLYMGGYNSDWQPTESHDNCEAKAVWMDTGSGGVLLIGIDCVALSGTVVEEIRTKLSSLCEETGCTSVNVYATHTHAGLDTLGLWGPLGVDGKSEGYMQKLIDAAVEAAGDAVLDRQTGTLRYGKAETQKVLYDSRYPEVFDPNLHQLRFVPDDPQKGGIRLFSLAAHAESMRGANRILSRDFPGELCDNILEQTGDRAMFMPGAIGGLIMTDVLLKGEFDPVENMLLTANVLTEYALSIDPTEEILVSPVLSYAKTKFEVPLDNTAFMLMKFLGILENPARRGESGTGYILQSEITVLSLGEISLALIPGEIFPELVYGGTYGQANPDEVNPTPLCEIASNHGIETLLIVGLANDELGYIVPPSDFMVHPTEPYFTKIVDYKNENHYEETNSVGPKCAQVIADIFESLITALENA